MTGEIFSAESFLWNCIWQSTIFLAAGLLISYLLRRHSARAHRVLFLSMIVAVILPAVSLLIKHYELGVFVAEPAVIQPPSESRAIYETTAALLNEVIEHSPTPIIEDSQPVASSPKAVKFPWRSALIYTWITASLILAARLLVTFVLGVRLLRRAMPLDCGKIEQAIDQAKTKLGISRDVKIYGSANIHSPVIWCWRRTPVLLVPSRANQSGNKIDWAGVLCHELAHYKRRDHVAGLLAELTVCFLPWHPLLWWAKSRLISLSEQSCDDWVVASGRPGTDYAESLLNLTPEGQMAFVPAVVRSKKGLAGRIQRILENRCASPRSGWRWSIAAMILAACIAMGVAFAQKRPATQNDAGQDIQKTEAVSTEAAQDSAISEGKVKLCLLDTSGKPVVGAKVGTNVRTRETAFPGSRLSWTLRGGENNVSNERGEIELTQRNLFLDWWPQERKAALYVLHEERKIGAICEISKDDLRGEIPLTLEPVCHVHGKLGSKGFERIGWPLRSGNVDLKWNSHNMLNQSLYSPGKEIRFEFFIPAGEYELRIQAMGANPDRPYLSALTQRRTVQIKVEQGQSELDLGTVNVPASKLADLIGKPAPEFDSLQWMKGRPTTLSELKGKAVLLYFGLDDSNPRSGFSELIELHNQFADNGLTIIAIYNCKSMKELKDKWAKAHYDLGAAQSVPFRVALDEGAPTFVGDIKRLGAMHGIYDITEPGITIFIEPTGTVAGVLNIRQAADMIWDKLGLGPAELSKRFEQIYRLDEDEVLKRIAPPFIPERKEFFANERPSQAERNPEGPAMMIFHWRDNKANLSYTLDHPSFNLSNLVRYIFKIGSPDMWWVDTGNYSGNPDGPEQLLGMKLPGDWILRNEAPPEAKIQGIQKLIADQFGRNITIRSNVEQRDVIVATGQFKFSPVYSDEAIVMFADEDESVRKKGETILNGTNTIGQFLQHLEWLVSVPVIDRTEVAEDTRIEYRAHLSNPSIRRIRNISEKKDKLRFFLDTLSKQTNLKFEITHEPIEVWFVTEETEN